MRFVLNAQFVTPGVTNWTTAAGLALLVGGVATLISLRRVLFGRDREPGPPPELTQIILTWPPIHDDHPTGRAIFPGRPGDRPTVMEKRPT